MSFSRNLLNNRKILVTGAGKGIGKACAQLAANCGAEVIVVSRTQTDLDSLSEQFPASVTTWCLDINSPLFHEKLRQLPKLDGIINNAGINRVAPIAEQSEENINDVIDMNIRSVYQITQSALPALSASDSPSIVNMSSQMGFVGSPGRTLYCMSKHAVEGLTKALAVELAPQNIRVNTVAPTFVKTPMTEPMLEDEKFRTFVFDMIPLRRLADPDDVANACIFLLSDLAKMITGTSIKVDGGWTAR